MEFSLSLSVSLSLSLRLASDLLFQVNCLGQGDGSVVTWGGLGVPVPEGLAEVQEMAATRAAFAALSRSV